MSNWSERWSISKRVRALSYDDFKSLTSAFQDAASRSFGTPAEINIRAMDGIKCSITKLDDELSDWLAQENKKKTFFETSDLKAITKDIWHRAKYVEVNCRPISAADAPNYAFGRAEFKGHRPRQATFYLQCGNDDAAAKASVIAARPFLAKVGNGYKSNATVTYG